MIDGGENNSRVDCVWWHIQKISTLVQNKIFYKTYILDFVDLEN